jgi:hypothetical protein
MANHQGFTHIAFEVENVHKIFEMALANKGAELGQVVEKKVSGIGWSLSTLRTPKETSLKSSPGRRNRQSLEIHGSP